MWYTKYKHKLISVKGVLFASSLYITFGNHYGYCSGWERNLAAGVTGCGAAADAAPEAADTVSAMLRLLAAATGATGRQPRRLRRERRLRWLGRRLQWLWRRLRGSISLNI